MPEHPPIDGFGYLLRDPDQVRRWLGYGSGRLPEETTQPTLLAREGTC